MGPGMATDFGQVMDTRLGWLAAATGFVLALARMGSLLVEGTGTVPWLLILLAAAILGGLATAATLLAGARSPALVLVTALGACLAQARVAAGSTLALGFIPTASTPGALSEEIAVALELLRFGAAPVLAVPGLVAVLAAVVWMMAAVVVVGGVRRRPLQMVVPVVVFYLILATLDRSPVDWRWPAGLALTVALGLLAGRAKRAAGRARNIRTGRVIPASGRGLPATVVASLALASVLATGAFASTIPESGLVAWRNATGFGGGLFGGVSYNLFTSMQQDLVGNDSTVVFVARVSEASPPNDQLYWKLITLDSFDGKFWLPANFQVNRPDSLRPWEASEFAFVGPTIRVEQVVQILALRQNYLPLLYSPVALLSDDPLLDESHRIREDGSVKFDARTTEGLIYRVTSDLPQPDLSVLASAGGRLSPIFAQAAAAGEIAIIPSPTLVPLPPTRVREVYTDLPDDLPNEIGDLAKLVTDRSSTNYERALLLEAFFRSSGLFVYDASASTGHSTLDLAEWLTNTESLNYRTGYCEQFAAAMAVMARTLGIPSRMVMGFAPGEVTTDGSGQQLIVVRSRNAHAWVELYFGGQGWVRFDPTPRGDGINPATVAGVGFDPQIYLPAPGEPGTGQAFAPVSPVRPGEEFLEPGSDPTLGLPIGGNTFLSRWLLIPLGAIALASLIPVAKTLRSRSRLRRVAEGDVVAAWREITDMLRDLGYRLNPAQTPRELAISVDRGLLPLAHAVSASFYGGKVRSDRLQILAAAEMRVRKMNTGWRWWRSLFVPRSLITRGPLDLGGGGGGGFSGRRRAALR